MLSIVALAMDLVWGYCGILSLGHFAFFGLGGYVIGMWLMFERTKNIDVESTQNNVLPLTETEISEAVGTQIFGVVGGAEIPLIWSFADSLLIHIVLILLVPGVLAYIFGWLAFRSRVTGVYLSILTQAMTLALSLYLFQNDSGLRGNNGLSSLHDKPLLPLKPLSF
jgi:urea transport system permease protein